MDKKTSPVIIGLLQALGVAIYCSLIAFFFRYSEGRFNDAPEMAIAVLMLCLLVFSVAVSGLIVFGRAVLLALDKKIKEALTILGYTFLFLFFIIIIILYIFLI